MKLRDVIKTCSEAVPHHISWDQNEIYGEVNMDIGDLNKEIKKVLYCVTPTHKIVNFYKKHEYDLLIAHHPFPVRDPRVKQLIYHTALDCCENGLNDMWRDALNLKGSYQHIDKTLGWYGEIDPVHLSELQQKVKNFSGKVIGEVYLKPGTDPVIKTVVICSGLGGLITELAEETKADCYITGQLTAPAATSNFKAVIETGHTASEWMGVRLFQKILPNIQVDLAPTEMDIFGTEICVKSKRSGGGYL